MLTNKITGFSADLLNTVRGILGEAKKHTDDCDCEKCEAEEMEEGHMPTSDEPSAADKKTADKVRAMMAKEKKLKEDIMEIVNEASDGLADKAKKSGVSLSTLKKVYARGIAAWNSGHRPGTTPQQWAHARVNSYITKGKGTYGGADKDLRSEGHDMPFEGPYKKVGDRKDEYGNKVKNVAKFLAKKAMNKQKNEEVEELEEAKMAAAQQGWHDGYNGHTHNTKMRDLVYSNKTDRKDYTSNHAEGKKAKLNEEVSIDDSFEQIDEISAQTVGSYREKAYAQQPAGDDGSQLYKKRKAGRDMAFKKVTHGAKVMAKEEAGKQHIEVTHVTGQKSKKPVHPDNAFKALNHYKSLSTTKSARIVSENSEQIDELSVNKLDQYRTKARTDIIDADANDDNRMYNKRTKGYVAASKQVVKKQANEEVEQIDEVINFKSLDAITKGHDGKTYNDTFNAHGSSIHNKIRAVRKERDDNPNSKHARFAHTRMLGAYADWYRNKKAVKEETEGLDEISKATMGRYINKAKDSIDLTSYRQGVKDSSNTPYNPKNPLEKKLTKRHKGISTAVSKLTKEEEDFVDSLNNEIFEKADPYDIAGMIKKAKAKNDPNHPAMKHVAAIEDMKKTGGALSVHGDHVRSLIKALGEEVELDEARGRPRKAGAKDFTIHPKTKEKLMHNNPEHMKKIEVLQKNGVLEKPKVEAGQHIITQLSKAKTSMLGGSTIHFTHGDSKHVAGNHAAKLLGKYADLKPSEKENFQKYIGHSHENLMKHV